MSRATAIERAIAAERRAVLGGIHPTHESGRLGRPHGPCHNSMKMPGFIHELVCIAL
jgi:hypothetical protein